MARKKSLQKQLENVLCPLAVEMLRQQLSGEKSFPEASIRAAVRIVENTKSIKVEEKQKKQQIEISFGKLDFEDKPESDGSAAGNITNPSNL